MEFGNREVPVQQRRLAKRKFDPDQPRIGLERNIPTDPPALRNSFVKAIYRALGNVMEQSRVLTLNASFKPPAGL